MATFRWQRMCCVSSYFIALRRKDKDPAGSRLLSLTWTQPHRMEGRGPPSPHPARPPARPARGSLPPQSWPPDQPAQRTPPSPTPATSPASSGPSASRTSRPEQGVGERRAHLDRNGQPVLSEGLEEETPLLSGLLDGHQVPRELGEEGHALQNLWERGSRWEHADAWPPCQPWFLPPHDPRGCALGSPMEGFGKVTADASLLQRVFYNKQDFPRLPVWLITAAYQRTPELHSRS